MSPYRSGPLADDEGHEITHVEVIWFEAAKEHVAVKVHSLTCALCITEGNAGFFKAEESGEEKRP